MMRIEVTPDRATVTIHVDDFGPRCLWIALKEQRAAGRPSSVTPVTAAF